jgi:type I restriction enzyme S subunit
VKPGDLVVNPMWLVGGGVAVSDIGGAVSPAYRVYRPGPLMDGRFLHHYMRSQVARTQYDLLARGITTFDRSISREDLEGMPVPAPPISVQRAIAKYLDAETARIDAVVASYERLIALLEARFLEMVRLHVTGGMSLRDPLDVRTPDVFALGWTPVKLGADLQFGSGTTPTAGDARYYGSGTPWLVTASLRDGPITDTAAAVTKDALREFGALKIHPAGSLVVAMYGATIGRLGITTFPATVNQACCVMHTGSRLDIGFLFFYLLAHRTALIELGVGAGQPNISQEILRSLRVAAPSRLQQERIVSELGQVGAQVRYGLERLRAQVALMLERRQALVTTAVTGRVEIPGVAA